jgi:hypothetical protein
MGGDILRLFSILSIVVLIVGTMFCGCMSGTDEYSEKPLFNDASSEQCAYNVIYGHDGVKDVDIEKNGRKVEIFILISPLYNSKDYLKEVGADAIRAVMTSSTDTHKPDYPIGESDYDYSVAVGIYGGDNNPVIVGTKDHDSEYLAWSDGTYSK